MINLRSLVWLIVSILIFLIITGATGWLTLWLMTRGGDITVPSITGINLTDGILELQRHHFYLVIDGERFDPVVPRGYIIQQSPLVGELRKKYSTVKVVLSAGPEQLIMPDLRGFGIRQGRIEFEKLGLGKILERSLPHASLRAGDIAAHIPAPGELAFPDRQVDVIVSSGPPVPEYRMPDLIGKTIEDVQTVLDPFLNLNIVRTANADLAPGTIYQQTPAAGHKLSADKEVTLVISPERSPNSDHFDLFTFTVPPGILERELEIAVMRNGQREIIRQESVQPYQIVRVYINSNDVETIEVVLDGSVVFTENWMENGGNRK